MNRLLLSILVAALFASCNTKEGPDVSGIQMNIETVRFEKDFFAIDTNNLSQSLDILYRKYPVFFRDFTNNILGIPPVNDNGEQAMNAIRRFLHDYRPVYDSVQRVFPDLERQEKQIEEALKYIRYYFPAYQPPSRLITFVGPMDAFFEASTAGYGDVITSEGLAVGLQLHLGSNFSMYQSEMGLSLYPAYISKRFSPEYIPVNSVKNVIDDLFPDRSAELTLVEQMVEKGKRLYLLDKFMPNTPDTLKIGYTKLQLDGCRKNEGLIWNYFIKNGLVFNNDPSLIKNYIGEAPSTPEFGEGAPGYIGLFVGWEIVKAYMEKQEKVSLADLMQVPAKTVFEQSRYRPK